VPAAVRTPSEADGWYAGSGADDRTVLRLGPGIGGDVVESATANTSVVGTWTVNPVLRPGPAGIDPFNGLAGQCFARSAACPTGQLAIVVGDVVLAAPTINSDRFNRDQIELSGSYTAEQARNLADVLNLGDLPVTLRLR
jgi:preprotein translocase subunit SecD